ncbi:MAG: MFS transporter [Firmicutes bacterium]|nr:MFS transporter [Dethiobacter sp.]MBS3889675.1 MFS transporter [Bacillota bacterium]MBS4054661.1 MFS transporter [Thermaerobacter sp.]MBS4054994.1 MFS transporter [Thermaerobacter sp.]
MEQWRKNLFVLWVGTFVAGMSFSIVSPFMPNILREVGVGHNLKLWTGIAISASFLMSSFMAPVWGALADKHGRKVMIVRAGLGMAVIYVVMAYATSLWQVIVLRLLNGLVSGFIPASTALVACNTPDEKLGSALGFLQTGGALGAIMGPLIGGVTSHFLGIKYTLLWAGVMLLAASAIVVWGVRETVVGKAQMKTDLWRDLKFTFSHRFLLSMLLVVLLFQAAASFLQPVLPLFVQEVGGGGSGELATGAIFSLVGIATVIAAPRWGSVGEKRGFRFVLTAGLVGGGILALLHIFARDLWSLGLYRFAYGLFIAALMPACHSLIAKSVTADFRGRAFGFSSSFAQFGFFLGPMVGGAIGEAFSIQGVFIFTGVLLFVTALWVRGLQFEGRVAMSETALQKGVLMEK